MRAAIFVDGNFHRVFAMLFANPPRRVIELSASWALLGLSVGAQMQGIFAAILITAPRLDQLMAAGANPDIAGKGQDIVTTA